MLDHLVARTSWRLGLFFFRKVSQEIFREKCLNNLLVLSKQKQTRQTELKWDLDDLLDYFCFFLHREMLTVLLLLSLCYAKLNLPSVLWSIFSSKPVTESGWLHLKKWQLLQSKPASDLPHTVSLSKMHYPGACTELTEGSQFGQSSGRNKKSWMHISRLRSFILNQ